MKTLLFCAVYAVFACVFCIGFAASQLPSETTFSILAAILLPVVGLGFTLFFAEEIRKNVKQIVVALIFLVAVCVGLIFTYSMPANRAALIGTWSSDLILIDAMDNIDVVGSAACIELLRRDRLSGVRAIVQRPPYAKSACVDQGGEDLHRTLLGRWDEQLFSKTGTVSDAAAIRAMGERFPDEANSILLDCAIRAPSPEAQGQCKKYVSELSPKTILTSNFEWWAKRPGWAPRFTVVFAPHRAEGLEDIGGQLVQRLVLRQSCANLTSGKEDLDLKNAVRGWMRFLKCYNDDVGEKIAISNVCIELPSNVSEGERTAEQEVCSVLTSEQNDLTEAEKTIAKRDDLADLGRDIGVTQTRPDVDSFIEQLREGNTDSISSYSENDMSYLIQEMKIRGQEGGFANTNAFSKEGIQKKRIQQALAELKKKKGMEKYFNSDGSINEQAVNERAQEEGVINTDEN